MHLQGVQVTKMVASAKATKNEMCGLIIQRIGTPDIEFLECVNVANDPSSFFEIDNGQIEVLIQAGYEIVAVVHSHPLGPWGPSDTDVAALRGIQDVPGAPSVGLVLCGVPGGWQFWRYFANGSRDEGFLDSVTGGLMF